MKQLLTGNEAIARGLYEAGLGFGSAYPGTPSTEVFENLAQYKSELYCEWAPNEKVAVETAYGACVAGLRTVAAMKHVGMNVAADPIFTATYMGVGKGFILITADDPDMHSSQNEQDNRYYAKFAKMPMFEPADSQECKDFIKEAYEVSEKFDIPVLFRVTTRVCHSKSLVEIGERKTVEPLAYAKNTRKFVCTPANAYQNHVKLEKTLKDLEDYSNNSPLNAIEMKGSEIGVISSSIAYQYAKEAFPEDASFFKIGLSYPLPMKKIKDFASKVKTLYVVEELEPFMEEQIKAAGITVIGKEKVPLIHELNPAIVAESVFGKKPATKKVDAKIVSRPPTLCPGCPHRGFFYTLSKGKNYVITNDIGCYTLGSAAPLNCGDTGLCMGGGFSVGMGMSKAFQLTNRDKKVFGVVGDSTFFHSGMTGAAEIIYNKGKMVPCILDNRITGMTGHQDNPGSGATLMGEETKQIDIEKVLYAFGYEKVLVVDPLDLAAMDKAVKEASESTVPAAIISRSPCLLIKGKKIQRKPCVVDTEKCKSCKTCLKVGCAAISMKDGKATIDATMCAGCKICAQVCAFKAIGTAE